MRTHETKIYDNPTEFKTSPPPPILPSTDLRGGLGEEEEIQGPAGGEQDERVRRHDAHREGQADEGGLSRRPMGDGSGDGVQLTFQENHGNMKDRGVGGGWRDTKFLRNARGRKQLFLDKLSTKKRTINN